METPAPSVIINAILELSAEIAREKTERREAVLELLRRFGLDPSNPPVDFDGIYVYTLVEYGVFRPEAVLNFFHKESVREAFRESFFKNDRSILEREAAGVIQWDEEASELGPIDYDPRSEFAIFAAAFSEVVDYVCIPSEARRTRKPDHLQLRISEILGILDGLQLSEIRAAAALLRQEHQVGQLGRAFHQEVSAQHSLLPDQSLFDKVIDETNFRKAWIKVRYYASTNLQCFDKPAYDTFEQHLDANLIALRHTVMNGIHSFSPLRVFEIPKGDDVRKIYFAEPKDAVVIQAIINVIGPIFEKDLSGCQ